jgi:uncharacterized membrane protein
MKRQTTSKAPVRQAVTHLDAHHRFMVSCGLGALAFALLYRHVAIPTEFVVSWIVFATSVVTLAWIVMATKDPYEVHRYARLQDSSQTFLFTVVVSAATASLFAVFLLLGSSKNLPPTSFVVHITLAVTAIGLSWMLVQTLFSLRYAHLYYIDAHKLDRAKIAGGLIFPEDANPDYFDFAYFSFVIGMTCQVSDVQISSKRMRRLAAIHGLISFAFNTAILAMFVNIIAGLI